MYKIHYYINRQPRPYEYAFKSLWAAIFKARAIFEEHGIAADVMNTVTGEIIAIFEPGNTYIDSDLETDLQVLALTALE